MQIQSVNNFTKPNLNQNPQFKSAYPVVHWVAEKGGGSYAPALTYELNKQLQGILVRLLNRTSKLSNTEHGLSLIGKLKPEKPKELGTPEKIGDPDYASNPIVRTFYNKKGGWQGRFIPVSYLITGNDVNLFNEEFGRPIGISSTDAPKIQGIPVSAEYNKAVKNYALGGLSFVENPEIKITDENKMEYGLHTKFEIIRNKNGEIKGYELIDLKFCPEKGKENPFVRTGYYSK